MKKLVLLILAWSFFGTAAAQFADDEPLPPEEVFKYKVYAKDANTAVAEFTILDEYYLYKDKFKFAGKTAGIELKPAVYPAGKVKTDEFFGKVETYRKHVAIEIPLDRRDLQVAKLDLDFQYQGCADAGLCYPPQKQKISLNLLPFEPGNVKPVNLPAKENVSILDKFKKTTGVATDDQEFLDIDQAFVFSAESGDGNAIEARWDIADGYYLYKDNFSFSIKASDGARLAAPIFPKGKEKEDEFFGKREVYFKEAVIKIPLIRQKTDATEIELIAKFQGCADAGFCYPPTEKTMLVALPAIMAASAATIIDTGAGGAVATENISEQDSIANALKSSNIWLTIITFFGFGLLLSFTPCVFPMIPILSSIIVGQGKDLSTRKSFMISVVYVLSMAVTYTIAGVLAGIFGQNLQAEFQNPWILGSFAIVFVLLSLSMFGFYDLQLPSSWQAKLSSISNSQKGGTYAGVGIMGFLSALIVGPCVAAPLMGALIYIGQTGDAVLGGIALFAMSLGMGAPLLAIGASAGKLLPRAGAWMESVKAVFGVLLLAVAIWMLERIIPPTVALFLWAVLLIISAVYMGALTHLDAAVSGWRKLWKGVGLVFLIYGGLLLVGVATNSEDPLQPLRGVFATSAQGAGGNAKAEAVHFKRVKSIDDLRGEIAAATAANKPVFLDFYADWCVSCKEMERYTFSDAGVQAALSNAVLLQADVTANDDIDKALLKEFRLIGPPSLLFFDRSGQEQREFRLVGFLEPKKFKAHVERAFQS